MIARLRSAARDVLATVQIIRALPAIVRAQAEEDAELGRALQGFEVELDDLTARVGEFDLGGKAVADPEQRKAKRDA